MTLAVETAAPERMQRRELSERAFAWALIAPALLFIVVIVVWPLVETIRLSFTDATLGGENWVGTANYTVLFADPKFWQIVPKDLIAIGALPAPLKSETKRGAA